MPFSFVYLTLKWLYTPLKFIYFGVLGLDNDSVPTVPQYVLFETALSKVACIKTSPVNPVEYTAAVCNASLPFLAGSAVIVSLL